MEKIDYTQDERLVAEAVIEARKIQDYIWQEVSFLYNSFNSEDWRRVFQKRVDKISEIKSDNPSYKIELRKRVLQQAALSILLLKILDSKTIL